MPIHKALILLRKIPRGKVVTYKELARAANTSPRGAASVLAHNRTPEEYPCYKVISSTGNLSGYSPPGGIGKKRKLLLSDGVTFAPDGTVESRHFHTFN